MKVEQGQRITYVKCTQIRFFNKSLNKHNKKNTNQFFTPNQDIKQEVHTIQINVTRYDHLYLTFIQKLTTRNDTICKNQEPKHKNTKNNRGQPSIHTDMCLYK